MNGWDRFTFSEYRTSNQYDIDDSSEDEEVAMNTAGHELRYYNNIDANDVSLQTEFHASDEESDCVLLHPENPVEFMSCVSTINKIMRPKPCAQLPVTSASYFNEVRDIRNSLESNVLVSETSSGEWSRCGHFFRQYKPDFNNVPMNALDQGFGDLIGEWDVSEMMTNASNDDQHAGRSVSYDSPTYSNNVCSYLVRDEDIYNGVDVDNSPHQTCDLPREKWGRKRGPSLILDTPETEKKCRHLTLSTDSKDSSSPHPQQQAKYISVPVDWTHVSLISPISTSFQG